MQSSPLYSLLATALLTCGILTAQTPVYLETFDADLAGYVTQGNYDWSANGTADNLPNWNDRSPIRSRSRGGAARFTGQETSGTLTSSPITLPVTTTPELYLSFYQYLRGESGSVSVVVTDADNTTRQAEFTVPADLATNNETSAGNWQRVDLTAALTGARRVTIQFSVQGALDFWLIDDISLFTSLPRRPTFPLATGETLTQSGRPFVVDTTGAPVVPNQLIIQFAATKTAAERTQILNQLRAVKVKSCVCDRLSLYQLPNGDFFDPATGEPIGDPSDILERVLGSNGNSKVDNIDFNRLGVTELQVAAATPNFPLSKEQIVNLPEGSATAIKIAILDTGVDYDHPGLSGYIYRKPNTACYDNDPLGWNFVDENNNPDDDNGHGTHVAGIVAQNLKDCAGCDFRIIPYKTHARDGSGTLFDAACATLQASVNDGADIINDSWGFYGVASQLMRSAIDTANAYGAIVVAAAGNDTLNLLADPQYPAAYDLPYVVGVGAMEPVKGGGTDKAFFTNYGADVLEIFANGTAITSTLPGGATGQKTGTSMSTPAVSAGLAMELCENDGPPVAGLLSRATKEATALGTFVQDGNLLELSSYCTSVGTADELGLTAAGAFVISPNPNGGQIVITAGQEITAATFIVFFTGGEVAMMETDISLKAGDTKTLDTASLAGGTYVLSIVAQGRRFSRRFVKR